jgi:hypothetical protein
MIRDAANLRKFESELIGDAGVMPYEQSLQLFTAMWKEGVMLGVLPPDDPLAGLDVDIRVARILNACLTKSSPE